MFSAFLILLDSYDELFWRSPGGVSTDDCRAGDEDIWARFIVKNSPEPSTPLGFQLFEEIERLWDYHTLSLASGGCLGFNFLQGGENSSSNTATGSFRIASGLILISPARYSPKLEAPYRSCGLGKEEMSSRLYCSFRRVAHHHSRASPVVFGGGSGRNDASSRWWIALSQQE